MWALAAQLSHKISTDSIAVLNSFKSGRCVDDVDGATPPFRCSDISSYSSFLSLLSSAFVATCVVISTPLCNVATLCLRTAPLISIKLSCERTHNNSHAICISNNKSFFPLSNFPIDKKSNVLLLTLQLLWHNLFSLQRV